MYDEYFPDKNGYYVSVDKIYLKYCEKNSCPPRSWRFGVKKSLENIGWTFKKSKITTIGKPPATINSA